MAEEAQATPLRWQHKANIGVYVLSFIASFGAQAPFFPGITNSEVAQKYAIIIQPASAAFSIWGVIFALEGLFTVLQALPAYRERPVINVVTPWWVAACLFQVLWTFIFALESFVFAQIIFFCLFFSMAGLLLSLEAMKELPAKDEWLLTTGFSIHTGWLMCAAAVGLNVAVLGSGAGITAQLMVAVVCLAAVFVGGAIFATALRRRPSFWVPLVVAWASFFINQELNEAKWLRNNDPPREFYTPWSDEIINAVGGAAGWLSGFALVLAGVAVALRVRFAYSAQAQAEQDAVKEQLNDNLLGVEISMGG